MLHLLRFQASLKISKSGESRNIPLRLHWPSGNRMYSYLWPKLQIRDRGDEIEAVLDRGKKQSE